MCYSNTQQQQLQQQLATAQRLLKMVALCSEMAHQRVRTAVSRLPNTVVALGLTLVSVLTVCMCWYLICFASTFRVTRVHMRPRSLSSSWACLRSHHMTAASQTMREAFNSRVHQHLHSNCKKDCSMLQCSSCTQ